MNTTTENPSQPPTTARRRHPAALCLSLSLAALGALLPGDVQALDVTPVTLGTGQGDPALTALLDPLITDYVADKKLPGIQVAVSKDGRLVFSKAYGFADTSTQQAMQPHHRNRIGSVSKIINAVTALKVAESLDPNLGLLDRPLYGANGLLPSTEPQYAQLLADQTRGRQRHTPVVGTIIVEGTDLTVTYYDDGPQTYSVGRTHDLDLYSQGNHYDLPPGQGPRDIRGMAASPDGFVYTWYADGSMSKGTLADLNAVPGGAIASVAYPPNQRADFLLGVGFAKSSGLAYAWFENGTRSYGSPGDLSGNVDTFVPATGKSPYDIRSLAIASNDRVYTFYGDDTVSAGTSRDLDAYRTLYATSIAADVTPEPWEQWYSTLTLRHLLSHTAGFRKDSSAVGGAMMFHPGEDPWVAARDLGLRDMHRYALSARALVYEPGTMSSYSNHGAAVAGWVMEELLNLPFKVIADLLVLDPLDLDMKRAWDPLDSGDASPHVPGDNDDPVACWASCPVDIDFSEQSGYLTGSADDLVRLMLAMDQDPSHPDILLPGTLTAMETQTISGSLMGWRGNTSKLSHNGAVKGGSSSIAKYNGGDRAGITVAVVTNIDNDLDLDALRDQIADAAAEATIPQNYDLHP
ncbi:MAG: serine hydrolase [Myxococcales bacterium]|nr:serine hydrolase [Myxococcales bacterium]